MPSIADIDKNLKIDAVIQKDDIRFHDIRECTDIDIYGLWNPRSETETFRRVPEDVAKATSEGVEWLAKDTAGGRIRFCTDSQYIGLRVVQQYEVPMSHMPMTGSAGFDLYLVEGDRYTYFRSFIPPANRTDGYESLVEFPDRKLREVLIHFPLYDRVKTLCVGLQQDAVIESGGDYAYDAPVVYYGSSITQGGCASRPGNAYQSIISRMLNCDHVNLGFSGSCKGEQAMVDFIADLDMSVFFLDYDHNAPNAEHLAATHENVYRCVRKAHPDVPIIMATKTDIPTTDAAKADTEARKAVVKATYDKAVAEGDENVYFIDGQTVFAALGGDSCTVDGCHPNDLGFYAMAQAFGDVIRKVIR